MNILFKKRGAVLLVILAVFSIIVPLIQGVWLDTQLEYQFRRYRINEMQARQNAKAGLGLSLLRIYIFKGVVNTVDQQWESILRPLVDRIWTFPFVWPLPITQDLLESDKQTLNSLKDRAFFKGTYGVSITPEDGLLDINDLSSTFEPLRNFTFDSIFRLLLLLLEKREDLKDKYQPDDFVALLNNLSDWTDVDNESQNGGSEELLEEGYQPLNRSFAFVEEITKTPGINQEIYELLSPHITVYGAKSLNINYASKEVLQASLGISDELVEQVLSRTQIHSEYYEPFLDQKAFCSFMNELGSSVCEVFEGEYNSLDLLRFTHPMAFRIKSTGEYRGQMVDLEALLYDLSSVATAWQKNIYQEQQRLEHKEQGVLSPSEQKKAQGTRPKATKESKMDYSYYKSLIIMYLKEGF